MCQYNASVISYSTCTITLVVINFLNMRPTSPAGYDNLLRYGTPALGEGVTLCCPSSISNDKIVGFVASIFWMTFLHTFLQNRYSLDVFRYIRFSVKILNVQAE